MSSPPKASIKERQRQLREVAIVDATAVLLGSKGYTAMTLDDVTSEVGISRSTLYQHFASKEDMVAAVLVRMIAQAHAHLRSLRTTLPPGEALRTFTSWILDQRFGAAGKEHSELSLILSLLTHDAVRAAESEIAEGLGELVALAQAEGSVGKRVLPYVVARTLFSVLRDPFFESALSKGELELDSMTANLTELLFG